MSETSAEMTERPTERANAEYRHSHENGFVHEFAVDAYVRVRVLVAYGC